MSTTQPRTKGGRFAPKNPTPKTTPVITTDATIAAIELMQNPKALALSQEVSRLRTELATKQSECNTAAAYLATVAEALDCKDPAKLAEKSQKLQGDLDTARTRLTASEREVSDLKTERKGYETGRRDVQAKLEKALLDLEERTDTLDRISAILLDCCERGELPLAVESLLQRCNQYGERSDAMGQANTALQVERDEARAALKLAHASISSLERTREQLGDEVDALTEEVGRLTPHLPLWSRILFAIVVLAIVAAVSHRAGFDAAIAFRASSLGVSPGGAR